MYSSKLMYNITYLRKQMILFLLWYEHRLMYEHAQGYLYFNSNLEVGLHLTLLFLVKNVAQVGFKLPIFLPQPLTYQYWITGRNYQICKTIYLFKEIQE